MGLAKRVHTARQMGEPIPAHVLRCLAPRDRPRPGPMPTLDMMIADPDTFPAAEALPAKGGGRPPARQGMFF